MANISRAIVLGITIGGVVCLLTCFALLITTSLQKKWIKYEYSENLGVATAVADIDIGLWKVEGTVVTTPLFGSVITTAVSGDTTDYDYFDSKLVKLCRAFSILAMIISVTSAVLAMVAHFVPKMAKPFLIASVSAAWFTMLVLMIALILVKKELKSGMSVKSSYTLGIVADVMAAVAGVIYSVVLVLHLKNLVESTEHTKYPDVQLDNRSTKA